MPITIRILGHKVKAMKTGTQFRAQVDGQLDRSIPPSPYKAIIYKRVYKKLVKANKEKK